MKKMNAVHLLLGLSWLLGFPGFAVELPPCPANSQKFNKAEDGLSVIYCARPVLICPSAENVEFVTYQKDGKAMCALAEGPALYHNKDKSTVLMHYRSGVLDGKVESYAANGQKMLEEHYRQGAKTGVRTEWHSLSGKKKLEENYFVGIKQGLTTEWYPSGKLKNRVTYKQGKRDGKFEEWFENGKQKRESRFTNGMWFGPIYEWYSDGKRLAEHHFNAGVREGITSLYHREGPKSAQLSFVRGKLDGRFIEWDAKGRKEAEAVYKDGKLVEQLVDVRSNADRNVSSLPTETGILSKCASLAGATVGISTASGCLKVDLDGNGHSDYVVPDAQNSKQCHAYLMRGRTVIKDLSIEEPVLELYSSRYTEGQFGEPMTFRDGLVVWGKGHNTRVYLYDVDREVLVRTEHASDTY